MDLIKLIDQNVECVDTPNGKYLNRSQVFEVVEKFTSTSIQQLKAEIAADMKNVLFNHQDYSHTELVAIIEGWQRQLSAV